MVAKYTRRADNTGWLAVRLSKTGNLVSLPEYTAVDVLREVDGRTFFKIVDGYISFGEEASLSSASAERYLSNTGPAGAASVVVTYNGAPSEEVSPFKGKLKQQWAELSFNGRTARVTLNSAWGGIYAPIAPGTHAILAPDFSHAKISTAGYAAATRGMVGNDVWFPIGLSGSMQNSSRYIHVGNLSEGCVTIYQLERWAALYQYLISHRVPGSAGKRIGSLVVRK